MSNRRNFIKKSALGTLGVSSILGCDELNNANIKKTYPRIISTWNHGLDANKKAWEVLKNGNGVFVDVKGVYRNKISSLSYWSL